MSFPSIIPVMRNPFFPRHSVLFKGGSSKSLDQAPSIPAPAPTTSNVDVQQKRREELKKQKKRRGLQSTIIAGREQALGGGIEPDKNVLLGGGA